MSKAKLHTSALLGATLLSALAQPLLAAADSSDRLRVNVQYRGTVKKSLGQLGTAEVTYGSSSSGRFSVLLKGSIRRPGDDRPFTFDGPLRFLLAGSRLTLAADTLSLSAAAAPHREKFLGLVPFLYLARQLPPPAAGEEGVRMFQYRGREYQLAYARSERQVEVTLRAGNVELGKFFLAPGWRPGAEAFEKFRMFFPEKNVSVSFVVD